MKIFGVNTVDLCDRPNILCRVVPASEIRVWVYIYIFIGKINCCISPPHTINLHHHTPPPYFEVRSQPAPLPNTPSPQTKTQCTNICTFLVPVLIFSSLWYSKECVYVRMYVYMHTVIPSSFYSYPIIDLFENVCNKLLEITNESVNIITTYTHA